MKIKELYSFDSAPETDEKFFNPDKKVILIFPSIEGVISLHGRTEITQFVCELLEYSEKVFIGNPMHLDHN